jgi:hypothetical protein
MPLGCGTTAGSCIPPIGRLTSGIGMDEMIGVLVADDGWDLDPR